MVTGHKPIVTGVTGMYMYFVPIDLSKVTTEINHKHMNMSSVSIKMDYNLFKKQS